MKTIELKLYNFSELSPEAQNKALEKYRYFDVEGDDDTYVLDHWKEGELEEMGFENAEIFYSGFNSQGDGASFDADVNVSKFIKANKLEEKFAKILKFEADDRGYVCINIEKNSYASHYSHESTRYAEFTEIDTLEEPSAELVEIESLAQELEKIVEEKRLEACKEIYAELEREYDYHTSDEYLEEMFESNEYTFEASGIMRNE
jgi:hypothetical protein